MAMRDADAELDLAARVARLTVGQRACLELVDDHATSKEIALRLGISRHTVDARLRQAMQTLGVSSRREAAVIWRAASATEPYQPFAYQPSQIEGAAGAAAHMAPTEEQVDAGNWFADAGEKGFGTLPDHPDHADQPVAHRALFEVADGAAMPLHLATPAATGRGLASPVRLWGGANDLTPAQRLIGILAVALFGMLAFGLLLSGIEALATLRS